MVPNPNPNRNLQWYRTKRCSKQNNTSLHRPSKHGAIANNYHIIRSVTVQQGHRHAAMRLSWRLPGNYPRTHLGSVIQSQKSIRGSRSVTLQKGQRNTAKRVSWLCHDKHKPARSSLLLQYTYNTRVCTASVLCINRPVWHSQGYAHRRPPRRVLVM